MNIYLVRHGEAASERTDPERPLTPLGREEVERVARMAAVRNVRVSAIFHSGILRAKQTAEILAEHLQLTAAVQPLAGLLPQDDPAIAQAELEAAGSPVMLVGHLPHLNRLAALLVCGDAERAVMEFAPATLACCVNDGTKWTISWTLGP
jgi:phosphohistidine phosphatase